MSLERIYLQHALLLWPVSEMVMETNDLSTEAHKTIKQHLQTSLSKYKSHWYLNFISSGIWKLRNSQCINKEPLQPNKANKIILTCVELQTIFIVSWRSKKKASVAKEFTSNSVYVFTMYNTISGEDLCCQALHPWPSLTNPH